MAEAARASLPFLSLASPRRLPLRVTLRTQQGRLSVTGPRVSVASLCGLSGRALSCFSWPRVGRWPCGLVTLCLHADTVPRASSVAWLGVGYFCIPRDDHQQPVLAGNPQVSYVSLDKKPSQSPPGSYRPPTLRASHGTSMSTSS